MKSLDWQARQAEFAGGLPDADVNAGLAMVTVLPREGEA